MYTFLVQWSSTPHLCLSDSFEWISHHGNIPGDFPDDLELDFYKTKAFSLPLANVSGGDWGSVPSLSVKNNSAAVAQDSALVMAVS